MKKIVFSFLMVSMMFISSCSSSTTTETVITDTITAKTKADKGEEVIKVTPETTTVKGGLNGCFEVVDRTYKLTGRYLVKINVELKRTSAPLPFNVADVVDMYGADDSRKPKVFGIGIEFLDADGDVVATETPYSMSSDLLLFGLNTDETATIDFEISADEVRNAVNFRVTSIVKENTYNDEPKEIATEPTIDYNVDYDIDIDEDLEKAVKTTKKAVKAAEDLYDVAKSLDYYKK